MPQGRARCDARSRAAGRSNRPRTTWGEPYERWYCSSVRREGAPGDVGDGGHLMRMVIIAESRAAADAIRQGLRFAPGMTVVGYADGRTQCAASVAAATPDLVLIGDL